MSINRNYFIITCPGYGNIMYEDQKHHFGKVPSTIIWSMMANTQYYSVNKQLLVSGKRSEDVLKSVLVKCHWLIDWLIDWLIHSFIHSFIVNG